MIKFYSVVLLCVFAVNVHSQNNPHGNNFDIDCGTCHSSDDWNNLSQNTFDHNQTAFALDGAHKKVNCVYCHTSLKFTGAKRLCYECHTDYHKNELGNDCSLCHSEHGWDDPVRFIQFHNQTNFPLTGVHAMIDCESCHYNEQQRQYANTPVECSECHLDVFLSTINPDHKKAAFDTHCQTCHSTTTRGWEGTIFAHDNNFPLTGGHAALGCQECHGENYHIIKGTCVDCHLDEYNTAANPNHPAFSFAQDCEECHTGIRWDKTIFSHQNVSGFAVEGRHKEILCTDCHINNQLSGLSLECVGCHQQEYNGASEPNHISALFPTSCEDCHSAKGWEPANWDHDGDYFPIYSGRHKNEWNDCSDCHVTAGNYTHFECIYCHEHRKSETDDEHRNRRNYVYESQACYNCHPKGRE